MGQEELWLKGIGQAGSSAGQAGNLLKLGGLFGGPVGWGLLGAGAIGSAIGIAKAPSAMELSRQRMKFFMENMQKIPGLADQFRNYLLRASGNQQANILGASQQYGNTMRRNIIGAGLQNTPLAGLINSMAASRLGQGMADMYGNYNQMGFQTANSNIMDASRASLTDEDMRNRMIGAAVGAGGNLLDRTLFPRTA